MKEDVIKELLQLHNSFKGKVEDAFLAHHALIRSEEAIIDNLYRELNERKSDGDECDGAQYEYTAELDRLYRQIDTLNRQLEERDRERDALLNSYKEMENTSNQLKSTLCFLQDKLEKKSKEVDYKTVLNNLLPIVARILNESQDLTHDKLDIFKENNLPIYYEMISYSLGNLGICLQYHNRDEMIPNFDSSIEVISKYTNQQELDGKVYKCMEWGYYINGEDSFAHKERVCAWIYRPEEGSEEKTEMIEKAVDPNIDAADLISELQEDETHAEKDDALPDNNEIPNDEPVDGDTPDNSDVRKDESADDDIVDNNEVPKDDHVDDEPPDKAGDDRKDSEENADTPLDGGKKEPSDKESVSDAPKDVDTKSDNGPEVRHESNDKASDTPSDKKEAVKHPSNIQPSTQKVKGQRKKEQRNHNNQNKNKTNKTKKRR